MKIAGIFAALFLACIAGVGQTTERWNGLVLDETTPLQAIALFGKPRLDRDSALHVYDIQPLLSADTAKRNFQTLEWENVQGSKSIMLTFSADDKLLMVFASFENEGTKSLESLCGGNWKPAGQSLVNDFRAEMSSTAKPGSTTPVTKMVYKVFALTPRAFCTGYIINEPKTSAVLLPAMAAFPGTLSDITIVSRAVEAKAKPKAPVKKSSGKR